MSSGCQDLIAASEISSGLILVLWPTPHPSKLVWTWRFLISFSFDILYNSRHRFADWNQMSPDRIYLAKCNRNSPFIYSSCGGWMDVLCVFAVDFQHERKFMATHCVCVCVGSIYYCSREWMSGSFATWKLNGSRTETVVESSHFAMLKIHPAG